MMSLVLNNWTQIICLTAPCSSHIKNFNVKLYVFANANGTAANAKGSAITLPVYLYRRVESTARQFSITFKSYKLLDGPQFVFHMLGLFYLVLYSAEIHNGTYSLSPMSCIQ